MDTKNWLLTATDNNNSYIAKTNVDNEKFLYRAICKWLIRGNASNFLDNFWEYIDKYDNQIEEALLDQLVTQAQVDLQDPQITNVRTKDYSIDITVQKNNSNDLIKKCKLNFVLYIYFDSLKKKVCINSKDINISWMQFDDNIENIEIKQPQKTPAHLMKKNKRVSKRSSKIKN